MRKTALLTVAMVMCLLALSVGPVRAGDRTVDVDWPGGNVDVEVLPDGAPQLEFEQEGQGRWAFRGDVERLIGKSYRIRLGNRSGRMLKIVVGIDGLNVFSRDQVAGQAQRDVGAVVPPRSERVIDGWQEDPRTARRFVFSPPEHSRGGRGDDGSIGVLTVDVYEEAVRPPPPKREPRRPFPGQAEQAPSAEMGTAEGDAVDSSVRMVRFVASTPAPQVRSTIFYGRRPDRPKGNPLGVRVEPAPRGVVVDSVQKGSTAEEAGVLENDLIVKVDSVASPGVDDFEDVVRRKRPGEFLFLDILRGPHKVSMQVRL